MIKINNLSKTIKNKFQEITILKNINMEVNENEFVSIVGPSGSGKSTLLGILGGLDSPNDGEVVINGQDIYSLSDSKLSSFRNSHLGIVFQNFNLVPSMTVYENIEVPLIFSGKKYNSTKIETIIEAVGLTGKKNLLPQQLSGGEQQRTAIARALVSEPKILLADEPTGSLDITNSDMIMDLFKNLKDKYKLTIVMVTHSLKLADMTDRKITLIDGKIQ